MAFGYGRNTCPGRFLANNETKLILASILRQYDMNVSRQKKKKKKKKKDEATLLLQRSILVADVVHIDA